MTFFFLFFFLFCFFLSFLFLIFPPYCTAGILLFVLLSEFLLYALFIYSFAMCMPALFTMWCCFVFAFTFAELCHVALCVVTAFPRYFFIINCLVSMKIFLPFLAIYLYSFSYPSAHFYYSRTSMAQTPMARLPWLIRTRF